MKRLLFILTFIAFFAPQHAEALLCTPILGCTCTVTASDIDFGDFTPFAGPQDAIGQIEVDCTGVIDVAPSVSTRLDDGLWGNFTARKMRTAIGGNELSYNIYTTSQRNVVLGDGTGGSVTTSISGGIVTLGHWHRSTTMFARATPNVTTRPGDYSDTVVVRIVW